jgi:exodeoxyribonuclease VII large subunit
VSADGALRAAGVLQGHRAQTKLQNAAARLESLSPLAVLGRGYAVCWNEDRTRVIRKAADVTRGGRVRVTLSQGELHCDVTSTDD